MNKPDGYAVMVEGDPVPVRVYWSAGPESRICADARATAERHAALLQSPVSVRPVWIDGGEVVQARELAEWVLGYDAARADPDGEPDLFYHDMVKAALEIVSRSQIPRPAEYRELVLLTARLRHWPDEATCVRAAEVIGVLWRGIEELDQLLGDRAECLPEEPHT